MSIDEPMFQPFPSEIFFQNCEPFKTYEVPLVLRNSDKVATVFLLLVILSKFNTSKTGYSQKVDHQRYFHNL